MTQDNNNNNNGNTNGIGTYLVAELNAVIKERSNKIQAELEDQLLKQQQELRRLSNELSFEVAKRNIEQPIADESMPEFVFAPEPKPEPSTIKPPQDFGGLYRGGLPKSLWGW